MNMPPRNSVQPPLSQAPLKGYPAALASPSGTTGPRLAVSTWPLTMGQMATISSGTVTTIPTMVWNQAVRRMPRCWMAKVISRIAAPKKKVELMRSASPSFRKPRSTIGRLNVLMALSAGRKLRM